MKKTIQQLNSGRFNVEYFSAIYESGWGLWLVNPCIDTFTKSKTFDPMASLMPEIYWGIIYFCVGLTAWLAVRSERLNWRIFASLLLALSFISKSTLFFFGDKESYAGVGFAIFAGFNLLNFFDLMGEKWHYKQPPK